jgi:two-component system chemotaxis response regulator CheB
VSHAARDIVVVGASQGGVQALSQLTAGLPADFSATVFVVMHALPSRRSLLPHILGRAGRLPARLANDGDPIVKGQIVVAPPDNHLLIGNGFVRVLHGPKVNGHRPAVDPLFRSAADAYGPRVIGVVLTGGQDCGTLGLQDIKRSGGIAVVQDPATAECPDMPASAVTNVTIDYRLPLPEIARVLQHLVQEPIEIQSHRQTRPTGDKPMTSDAQALAAADEQEWENGTPTDFSCPDCGGVLREVAGGREPIRFRCRIGHALTLDSLGEEQDAALDLALSSALRALAESADLSRRVAKRLSGTDDLKQNYENKATRAEAEAAVIRRVLLDRGP